MKAPDKIYLEKSLSNPDRLHSQWYPNDVIGGGVEYIRKDTISEMANEYYEKFQEIIQKWNGSMFQSSKILECFAEFVDKINSL